MINFDIHIGQSGRDTTIKADDVDITHGMKSMVVRAEAMKLTELELTASAVGQRSAIGLSGVFIQAPDDTIARQFVHDLATLLRQAPEAAAITCEMEHAMRKDMVGGWLQETPTGEELFSVRVLPPGVVPAATLDEVRTQRDELAAALKWLMEWCGKHHDMAEVEPYAAAIQAISRVSDVGVVAPADEAEEA
jgi:hypothetical protein